MASYRWHKHYAFYLILLLFLQESRYVLLLNIDDTISSSSSLHHGVTIPQNQDDIEHNKLISRALVRSYANQDEYERSLRDQTPRFIYKDNGEKRELMSPDEYQQHSQSKRFPWVALGVGLLVGTSMLASVGVLTIDLILTKHGCCTFDYDTCDEIEEYNKYSKLCDELRVQTNDKFTAAENLMQNALELNTLGNQILAKIGFFDQLTDIHLDLIQSNTSNLFNNISQELSEKIDNLEVVYTELDQLQFDIATLFSTDWGKAVGIISFALIFTFAIYRIVKAYRVHRTAAAIAAGTQIPPTRARANAVTAPNVELSGFAWVKSQLTWRNAFAAGMVVLDIANIVFSIITILNTFDNCKKSEDNAKNATKTIKEQYVAQQEVWEETQVLYGNASESYNYIKGILTDDGFIYYCEQVSWLLGNASNPTAEEIQAKADIEEYIANYDLASHDVYSYYNLTKKIADAFYEVNYNMYCLVRKSEEADDGVQQCLAGADTITNLYNKMKDRTFQNSNCTQSGYITLESYTAEVAQQLVEAGYESDCLLNSAALQSSVRDQYCSGSTTDQIKSKISGLGYTLDDDQVDFLINIASPCDVSSLLNESIQEEFYDRNTLAAVLVKYYKYNASQVTESFENTPQADLDDAAYNKTCTLKCDRDTLDEVLKEMSKYKDDQVTTAYNETCPLCPWDPSHLSFFCLLIQFNQLDKTSESYLNLVDAYGQTAVDDMETAIRADSTAVCPPLG